MIRAAKMLENGNPHGFPGLGRGLAHLILLGLIISSTRQGGDFLK